VHIGKLASRSINASPGPLRMTKAPAAGAPSPPGGVKKSESFSQRHKGKERRKGQALCTTNAKFRRGARRRFQHRDHREHGEDKGQGKCPRFLFCSLCVLCELCVEVFVGCGQRPRCVLCPLCNFVRNTILLPISSRLLSLSVSQQAECRFFSRLQRKSAVSLIALPKIFLLTTTTS